MRRRRPTAAVLVAERLGNGVVQRVVTGALADADRVRSAGRRRRASREDRLEGLGP